MRYLWTQVKRIKYYLLFVILGVTFTNAFSNNQYDNLIFTRFSVKDGLSQGEVTSIIQDHYGFIWIGTLGGLNRYDGYDFLKFKPIGGDPNSITCPSIERLYEDRCGNIWIGTKTGGLNKYSTNREEFKNFQYSAEDTTSISSQRVISVLEDSEDRLWFGTWYGGINLFDQSSGDFTRLLPGDNVGSIIETRCGSIWAASFAGLWKFKEGSQYFEDIPLLGHLDYKGFVKMVEDPDEPFLWIVGWSVGLIRFNYNTREYQQFFPGEVNHAANETYSICLDGDPEIMVCIPVYERH